MATEKFRKDDLLNLLDGEECESLEKVEDSITGKSRWSIQRRLLFRVKAIGRVYAAHYSVGATESQDEGPFEYDPDEVECEEMRPVERMVVVYEKAE